jgi:hypothetical protein
MTGEEARDDPLIALPVAFQLFVQIPAEVNDGVPVIPARPPGITALTQPLDQPDWPPVRAGHPLAGRKTYVKRWRTQDREVT